MKRKTKTILIIIGIYLLTAVILWVSGGESFDSIKEKPFEFIFSPLKFLIDKIGSGTGNNPKG
jgi:hypothetical protein